MPCARLRATDLVIDVDRRNFDEGDDPVKRFCSDFGIDLSTWPTVQTGSGGRHHYGEKPADVDVVASLEKAETAEAAIDRLAKARSSQTGEAYEVAYDRVVRTGEGRRLYFEYCEALEAAGR